MIPIRGPSAHHRSLISVIKRSKVDIHQKTLELKVYICQV